MKFLSKYIDQIKALCENHKVKSLFVFGSVTNNKFSNQSDIDMVVFFRDISPEDYADNYFDLKFQLEELLKRPIDLLEGKAIRNPYLKKSIDNNKVLVYGG